MAQALGQGPTERPWQGQGSQGASQKVESSELVPRWICRSSQGRAWETTRTAGMGLTEGPVVRGSQHLAAVQVLMERRGQ